MEELTTFLMTDIEGSTRKWEAFPSAMAQAIEAHDAIVAKAVSEHSGRLIKERGEGDSHFIVFGEPRNALEAAVAIQCRLQMEDWHDVAPLLVRMALYTGAAQLRSGDFYGAPINRCARIRSAGHGGQILLSASTRALVMNEIPEGCRLVSLGQHRFRDLAEPECVYQLVVPGLPREFPPLRSIDPASNNLPIQLTSFVGRELELSELSVLLRQHRLVTLTGAGGCGKTRLGLQAAAELVSDMDDGVWFVELAGLSDAQRLPQEIATAMHLPLREPDGETLGGELSNLRCLLVLDNCEHLVSEVAALVSKLLRSCAHVNFLATSRERLAVSGERVFVVPPLACDLRGHQATLERVATLDSVKLLCERAASRTPERILAEHSAQAVAALCKKLDGIPLAIEQAASNLPFLSPEQILSRLDHHLSLLVTDDTDVDPRHRTLTATIDWSYEMLGEDDRLLFHRLAVFRGGWSLEAAESICTTVGLEAKEVLPLLQKLVSKSLASTEPSVLGVRRYRLLEPIREYALAKRPVDEEIFDRHFQWFSHLAGEADQLVAGPSEERLLARVSEDLDNIRLALDYGCRIPRLNGEILGFAVSMYRFWCTRGFVKEGVDWLNRALSLADEPSPELYATALNRLGILLWQAGQLDAAESVLCQSLGRWEGLGDELKQGTTFNNLGGVAFTRADLEAAEHYFEKAVAIFHRHNNRSWLATSLSNLGVVLSQSNHLERSAECLEEATALHRLHSNQSELAKSLDSLLGVYAKQGRFDTFKDLFVEACELAIRTEHQLTQLALLSLGANLAIYLGHPEWAARLIGAQQSAFARSELLEQSGERKDREAVLQKLQFLLPPETLRKSMAKGRSLDTKAAIDQFLRFLGQEP